MPPFSKHLQCVVTVLLLTSAPLKNANAISRQTRANEQCKSTNLSYVISITFDVINTIF